MSTNSSSGHGFKPDVNWIDSTLLNKQTNKTKEKGISSKLSLLEYLSHLQILSIQERAVSNKLDQDLFTVGQTMNGLILGFKTGIFLNILIVCYIFSYIFFSSDTPRLDMNIDFLITHSWILLVIITTIWLGYYSKYVVGPVTMKMVTSLFIGKMLSSLLSGGALVYLFIELKYFFEQPDLINQYLQFLKLEPLKILQHYNQALILIVFQIVVSSFFAFVMLQFRHFFITGDMKKDYEDY